MGEVKRPGPKTRGQLVVDKFSVGYKVIIRMHLNNFLIPIEFTKLQVMTLLLN